MLIGLVAVLMPVMVVAIIAFTVLASQRIQAQGGSAEVRDRLSRLEASVEELRAMVYDAVIDVDEAQRIREYESPGVRVDA